jgi:hypothetical protein
MPGSSEAAGQTVLCLQTAAGQVEHFAAPLALKVMVMLFAGNFVSCRVSRNIDGGEPCFGDEQAEIPVNRGNTDAGDLCLCGR